MFSERAIAVIVVVASIMAVGAICLQILSSGAFGEVRKGELTNGYWGPVDSSVDWCEENYVSTSYVAEIFNTVTSVVPFLAGLALVYVTVTIHSEKRFLYTAISTVCVGLGSIAFHGTMRRGTQALDEVPMVWVIFISNYSAWEMHSKKGTRQSGEGMPYAILAVLLFLTYLNVFTEGQIAAMTFHLSFAPSFLIFIYGSFVHMRATTDNDEIRSTYADSFVYMSLAGVSWAVDNVACGVLQNLPFGLPNPQLHAWGWHIFIGYGAYMVQLAMIARRKECLEEPCEFRYLCNFFPYLVEVDFDPAAKNKSVSASPARSRAATSKSQSAKPVRSSSSRGSKKK